MSQTESPQTEVWGSVRDTTQTVLNGVNTLMNHRLAKVKLNTTRTNQLSVRRTQTDWALAFYSIVRSFVHQSTDTQSSDQSSRPSVPSLINSFVPSLVHPHALTHTHTRPPTRTDVYVSLSVVRSFVRSFVCSLIKSQNISFMSPSVVCATAAPPLPSWYQRPHQGDTPTPTIPQSKPPTPLPVISECCVCY